ncbi:MAG TPA: DUF1365 domain-containing protein, partial [Kofleriaceae bacterium]|nr:DUF1365 domain-containing protein [Kofleriaceae bacterium]
MSFHSALYRGELMHARHDAIAKRAFRYPVYMASLDLDELPALDRELRLFSHRRANLFSFDDRDYAATLSPGTRAARATAAPPARDFAGSLVDDLAALRAANGIATPATTRLVTNLRVAGYVFNPVSFFLDYDARGSLASVIAEVNNTYGGRLRYVLGPRERIASDRVGFRHARELFVSPFLHGDAAYDFWFDAPLDGDRIAIDMHVQQAGARSLTARFTATRTPLSDRALAGAAIRYPLMTAQVIGLIHYEAIKMRFAGVPYRRPGVDHRPLAENGDTQ